MTPESLNGASLAYIGDAVIELIARKRSIESGVTDVGILNEMTKSFITAHNQSLALENILPLLNDEEEAVYRRGRNSGAGWVPKSSTRAEYSRATGFEALFGYLHLKNDMNRIEFLFNEAYPKVNSAF